MRKGKDVTPVSGSHVVKITCNDTLCVSVAAAISCSQCNTKENGMRCAARPPAATECKSASSDHCTTVVTFTVVGECRRNPVK